MRKTMTLVLTFITLVLNAQQEKFASEGFPGIQQNVGDNQYYLAVGSTGFFCSMGNVGSNDVTLVKLDKDAKKLWSIPDFKDYLGSAIFGNNILVFSSSNSGKNGYYFLQAIHATLLDNSSGKILAEKDIPSYSDKTITDVSVLTDSTGDFKYLILRVTEMDKARMFPLPKDYEQFGHTVNLQAITFDNNLNPKINTLDISGIQKAQYIGRVCNVSNDIFIATVQNSKISVNKYEANTLKIVATVNADCQLKNDVYTLWPTIGIQQNTIWFAGKFDTRSAYQTMVTGVFDFDSKSAYIQEEYLGKDYLRKYADKTARVMIVGSCFYDNKFIIIKEISKPNQGAEGLGPMIISIYNSEMKLLKEVTADERFSMYYVLPNSYYKLRNNQLYVFYNSTRFSGLHPVYQTINLDDYSVSNAIQIKIDDPKLNALMYGKGIIWFNNTALLPYPQQNNPLHPNRMFTKFKAVDF